MPRDSAARAADRRVQAALAPEAVAKGSSRSASASIAPESVQAMVDLEFVRGLIEAVDQSSVDSLEISQGRTRIRISKTPPAAPVVTNGASAAPLSVHSPVAATQAAVIAPVEAPAPKSNLIEVKSPMVGTFYRAPAPEAPPYVEVGSTVRKGQTLCILEAMKLMNELDSEVDGIVREVMAENTEPVEYGQVLFRIEPSGSA